MKNEIVTLRKVEKIKDADGYDLEKTVTERTVFASKKSVTRSEFYEAMRAGFTATAIFEINKAEYDDETEIKHGEKLYTVIRTYEADINDIELTCADKKVD